MIQDLGAKLTTKSKKNEIEKVKKAHQMLRVFHLELRIPSAKIPLEYSDD